jgi:hypothetical protein
VTVLFAYEDHARASIVRVATPSSAIAAAAIALLAALLDIGNHETGPTWDDYNC